MTLQPDSNAGKVRAVLDREPHLSNKEVSRRVGKVPQCGNRVIEMLDPQYVAEVRRKFGYPKPDKSADDKISSLPIEAFDWMP